MGREDEIAIVRVLRRLPFSPGADPKNLASLIFPALFLLAIMSVDLRTTFFVI